VTPPVFLAPTAALAGPVAEVTLDGPEGRHAVAVRRLLPGERVDLVDGAGLRVEGVVRAVAGRDTLHVSVVRRSTEPPPQPRLVLAQALAKGDRGELAVELATEAGVDEVLPFAAERSVVRWQGERGERALARWRSAAAEAAKQARRARWPLVSAPVGAAELAGRLAAASMAVILDAEGAVALAVLAVPASGDVVVVVGPEGGLTGAEREAFAAAGAVEARLGPTVLRTSTAGVAALAVLSAAARWR